MKFENKGKVQGSSSVQGKVQGEVSSQELKPALMLPLVEVKILPSGFKAYKAGAKIHYRPYTFGEVKMMSQSKMSRQKAVDVVLSGVDTSFEPKESITVFDYFFIALLRKLSTMGGSQFTIATVCPKCKQKVTTVGKLTDLEFDDLEVPELPIVARIGGQEMHFMPLTVKQWMELHGEKGKESEILSNFAKAVVNVPFEKAYGLINNANPEDSEVLNQVDKLLYHGIKPKILTCANKVKTVTPEGVKESDCGHQFSVELEGDDDVVYPLRGDPSTFEDRIRFGLRNGP